MISFFFHKSQKSERTQDHEIAILDGDLKSHFRSNCTNFTEIEYRFTEKDLQKVEVLSTCRQEIKVGFQFTLNVGGE